MGDGVFRVQDSGFGVQRTEDRDQVLHHYSTEKAHSSGLAETGYNLVVRVQGSGFRVHPITPLLHHSSTPV